MESSRRSPPADAAPDAPAAVAAVRDAVRDALAPFSSSRRQSSARVAVALSGGRDSMVLLDAVAHVASPLGIAVSAAHVHHGISRNADAWARFCADECARRAIALEVRRVEVGMTNGDGVESAARRARYDALAAVGVDAVALAHHADDQAETVLLQLLRGAGPHGLAAMPALRAGTPALLRPLLALRRADIVRYAAQRSLAWVDDESNADVSRTRNRIRHLIGPQLAASFPGYPATLARAASHQAEAAQLADELAAIDAQGALADATLARERLASLPPHRARNLMRWFLREQRLRAPSSARLATMLDQLRNAVPDARVRIVHDGAEIGIHRGRIVVHPPPSPPFAIAWRGEARLALPHGWLEFAPTTGEGLAAQCAHADEVVVRSRRGGERIRLAASGPSRSLKHAMQQAGVAHWTRPDLPLVFCGGVLAAVPGLGVDAAFAARAGDAGYALRWHRRER